MTAKGTSDLKQGILAGSRSSRRNFNSQEVTMRHWILAVVSLFAISTLGQAQEIPTPRALAHVSFGAGGAFAGDGTAAIMQVSGGGEGLIYKGLGAGGEIGYLFPRQAAGEGFGLLSTNGFYHFPSAGSLRSVIPFVTAGYSLAFRNGSANLMNFGGGVDYWFSEHAGLRLEARDHVWPGDCRCSTAHLVTFRIGLVGR